MRRFLTILLAGAILATAAPTKAGVAFRGTRGLIRSVAADNLGKGKLNFQLSGYYFKYGDLALTPGIGGLLGPTPDTQAIVDYHFFITRPTLTYAVSDFLELGASLDIRNWLMDPKERNGHNDLERFTRGGLGDTQLSGKITLPIPAKEIKVGALGELNLPTGNKDRGFTWILSISMRLYQHGFMSMPDTGGTKTSNRVTGCFFPIFPIRWGSSRPPTRLFLRTRQRHSTIFSFLTAR
jgi:hypothetical protein